MNFYLHLLFIILCPILVHFCLSALSVPLINVVLRHRFAISPFIICCRIIKIVRVIFRENRRMGLSMIIQEDGKEELVREVVLVKEG